MIELSSDQQFCFDAIMSWYSNPSALLSMGGYAGCGKTTLIGKMRNTLPSSTRVAFCCFTGKASSVLRSKLQLFEIQRFPDDYCGTIHSLIYEPILDDVTNEIIGWALQAKIPYDLIVIDEASMVNEELFKDLCSYNIPILAVGDHGQLPPIDGNLNLMKSPMLKLEKVHRFAESNPITKVSILAREQGFIPRGTYGDLVHKVPKNHSMITQFINQCGDFQNSSILCGFNRTRIDLNKRIRERLGFKGFPNIGERIICLKNNKKAKYCPIYNGILGTVKDCSNHISYLKLFASIDGELKSYKGKISPGVFNNEKPPMNDFIYDEDDEEDDDDPHRFMNHKGGKKIKIYLDCFDFGYALTVHKSQGSEWDNVMVIEQPCDYWSGLNWNRWLYTAVTRAKNRLLIVR